MEARETDNAAPPVIDRLLVPFRYFLHNEVSGSLLLLAATVFALIWANSPWAESYVHLWETPVTVGVGGITITEGLHLWINDGLMAMFFFVIGLEIKREVMVGELSSRQDAILPIAAALGGMLGPALIYLLFNWDGPGRIGWGTPVATDIAFALGVLVLLGDRVPPALKVFLAAFAIADDLAAVLVIAFFYTSAISWVSLATGLGFLVILAVMNLIGVRHTLAYGVFGIGGVWLAFLFSGMHPTIAGVLAAMTIPASSRISPGKFVERSRGTIDVFETVGGPGDDILTNSDRQSALLQMRLTYEQLASPLHRLEKSMHPWVSFVVLPLFALANAGVTLEANLGEALSDPVALGVMAGLIVGKQAGITACAWAVVRLGWSRLPSGVNWRHIYGVSWLGGIGFTMSIFIAGLAFDDAQVLERAKLAILLASLVAGVVGYFYLRKQAAGDANKETGIQHARKIEDRA
ncbi:MAG TPA: Na+/H+ antiporter NhaA [Bryobacterales bacterium]|nr:Na+/H+ antiporter NhaA [Bryobacterales bacterium]